MFFEVCRSVIQVIWSKARSQAQAAHAARDAWRFGWCRVQKVMALSSVKGTRDYDSYELLATRSS